MKDFYDVVIVGAGPAGLCFARSLSMLGLSVALIEKQLQYVLENPPKDGRDIALTHFSRKILNELGVWQHMPPDSISTIQEARVSNGTSPQFMGLSSSKTEQLAFIVPNHLIREAAYAAVRDDGNIALINGVSVTDVDLRNHGTKAILSDGRIIMARLMAAADSRFSETRKKVGIPASMHDFGKTIVVCQMEHDLPHHGVAHECFLYEHTLAVLPLNGNRSSVIITVSPLEASRIMKLPEAELNAWVGQQFQHRFGMMRLDSERHAYPLTGVYAQKFVAPRFALIGDAAVGMHPVTAHGFNFGLRGQHTLSDLIKTTLQSGGDIGANDILVRYERAHQRATRPLYLATNSIVGLYTNDAPSARIARKILLRVANHMTPIKSFMMTKLAEKEPASRDIPLPFKVARSLFKTAA